MGTTPASPIPELLAQQNAAANQFNTLRKSSEVIEAFALRKSTLKAEVDATLALVALRQNNGTDSEKQAAEAIRDSAIAVREQNDAVYDAYVRTLNKLEADANTAAAKINELKSAPTSNQPTTDAIVKDTEIAGKAAGEVAANTTNTTPGVPPGPPPTTLPVTTPVTQTNIDNTTDTSVPDESDPNQTLLRRQSPPPVYAPSNIIESSQEPEIVAQSPVFTPSYPGALAAQTDGTVIGPADDSSSYDNADRLQTEANNATAEAARNSVTDNNDVRKNNTVVTSAEDPGAYDAADRQQTAINDGVPEKSFAQSVQDTEDAYPQATGSDINGISSPMADNIKLPSSNSSPGVALASGAKDWRFRIQLAPSAQYFYNSGDAGILAPLKNTNGVIFPYTPQISLNYAANYNNSELTHSNYKIYTYKNSSVEAITIAADFTAQDTQEANYLLAVIHFFRSVTKMFYGQDQNPQRGLPPPLCYLTGFGQYQFDMHPVAITSFTYSFPTDVDYVNAYPTNNTTTNGGKNNQPYQQKGASTANSSNFSKSSSRLNASGKNGSGGLTKGGLPPPPVFSNTTNISQVTRVPSKITIQLSCLPIVTRNAISNKFSLAAYSTGRLLQGGVNPGTGGGIW